LIFYVDKIMVMGNSKNLHVFSRFYSNRENRENFMLTKYTCFIFTITVVTVSG